MNDKSHRDSVGSGEDSQSGCYERRRRRSEDRLQALGYQLEFVKERLALEAMVLCDDLGEVLASAGEPELINNLAMQAPWLVASSPKRVGDSLAYLWEVCPGLAEEQIMLRTVVPLDEDDPMFLCGIGQPSLLEEGVDHTLNGVNRIIETVVN